MLGPPGAGKGTLSRELTQAFGFRHVSMGDVIRKEMADPASAFGSKARPFMEQGEYLPDSMALELFASVISEDPDQERWLFDGFPRTLPQARILEAALSEGNDSLSGCVALTLGAADSRNRVSQRLVCVACGTVSPARSCQSDEDRICKECGGDLSCREDDTPENVANRLKCYEERTRPLFDWFKERDQLLEFDASGTPEALAQEVVAELKKLNL